MNNVTELGKEFDLPTPPQNHNPQTNGLKVNVSGTQQILDVSPTSFAENYKIIFNIDFLENVPIDVAFTDQSVLDNSPDEIKFNTISTNTDGSFNVDRNKIKNPILILRTNNPEEETTVVLKVSFEKFQPKIQQQRAVETTTDEKKNESVGDSEFKQYIYIVLIILVIIFLFMFINKLSKKD
jgi:preprotein translocase subunit SecF